MPNHVIERIFPRNEKMHFSFNSGTEVFEKNSENAFFSQNGWIEKLMVPSESAPQELSNEWSCHNVSTILYFFGQFLCPALGDRSHHRSLKGYLVNCLEHFFLYFFCLQIKFPQLFAMFQILFELLRPCVIYSLFRVQSAHPFWCLKNKSLVKLVKSTKAACNTVENYLPSA
jgi:hypothetical protein